MNFIEQKREGYGKGVDSNAIVKNCSQKFTIE